MKKFLISLSIAAALAAALVVYGQGGNTDGGGGGTNPDITPVTTTNAISDARYVLKTGNSTIAGNITVSNIVYNVKTLTPGVSVDIDFNGPALQTLANGTNFVFTESNAGAGKSVTVIVSNDANVWTVAGPGWTSVGAAFPISIAASKTLVLTVTHTGTTTNSGYAATAAQP